MGFLQPHNNLFSLLYVEDEPIARELLQKVISRKFPAFEIHVADNGKVGLELFEKIRPDIVLTDVDLPLLDGMIMASEIRKLNPEAEIIILSGREKTLLDSDCVNIGVACYLKKPILHEVLFEALEDSIARITGSQRHMERAESRMKVVEC